MPRNLLTDSEVERARAYKKLISVQTDTYKRVEKEELMEDEIENNSKLIPENDRKYLTEWVKKDLDLFYVNKIVKEMLRSMARFEGRDILIEDYGKLVAFVVKQMEKDKFLKGMDPKKKQLVVREINRIFSSRFENCQDFKEHIQRVVTYRLQDLKREVVSYMP
jgi:hypothetical protein